MKQNPKVQAQGFDRGSQAYHKPGTSAMMDGWGCGGLDVTRTDEGHPQCSMVGIISQPVDCKQ